MRTFSATFECVPRYRHLPWEVLRAQLQSAALSILADGQRVSTQRLREHGVRGGTATLIALREELVASGELPPEAAARVYAPPKHPPGKASFRSLVSSQQSAVSIQEFLGPRNGDAEELNADRSRADKLIADGGQGRRTKDQGPEARRRRRSRRVVQEYNSAVRCIFGRARARQIGAAP